jgi:hypothetical protein
MCKVPPYLRSHVFKMQVMTGPAKRERESGRASEQRAASASERVYYLFITVYLNKKHLG